MKQKSLLVLLLTVVVTTIACTAPIQRLSPVPRLDDDTQVGTVYLAAMMPLSGGDQHVRAIATMSYHGMERMIELTPTQSDYVGHIDGLPTGDWSVEIRFFDLDGDVTHVASGTARVRPATPTTLKLQALPLGGWLEVTADLGSAFEAYDIQGARLNFSGNRYTTLNRSDDHPSVFTGGRELPPGDHDFHIVFYGDDFNAGSRIYPSPWQTVRIYPGKTVHVTWNAETSAVSIEMTLIAFPDPPTDVVAVPGDETIHLQWTSPIHGPVTGYKVYLKKGDLAAFTLVAETTDPFLDLPNKAVTDEPTWAVVTAVGASDQESFRSEPLRLDELIAYGLSD